MNQKVIEKLHEWLGPKGRHFFRTCAKLYKGDVIPVIRVRIDTISPLARFQIMPHAVHFREGMQVRNFLRALPECKDWTFEMIEEGYVDYIKEAMKENICKTVSIKSRIITYVQVLLSKIRK